ncbi:class I SAM-dependent methyltransferase [Maricaulaceae bacterium MS644]
MSDKIDAWTTSVVAGARPAKARSFPAELMLHVLLSERYTGWPVIVGAGARVLDVGVLHGANLAPFADRGCDCFGVEINAEMVALARTACAEQSIAAEIRTGTNTALPFEDGFFDLLLSVNVLHYQDDTGGLKAGLAEYARVLKPGGRAFIVTGGPQHFIRESAQRLGPNQYRLGFDDFRKGQVMAYPDDEADLKSLCSGVFRRVLTGRSTEHHPAASLDFFYALAER